LPGMNPGLNVDDPRVVGAFRAALLHQGLLALLIFGLLGLAVLAVRRWVPREPGELRPAPVPAGRLVLMVGFGNLWLFDGFLQAQSKMALGLPSEVIEPVASSSPPWVQHLVNWAGTTWSYHPVQAAAAAVWIQVGLGIWLIAATRGGIGARLAGLAAAGWGLVVWVFGEAFGGIFTSGQSWLSGAPGAVLIYVIAGGLIALPDRFWQCGPAQSARAGRVILAGLGVFLGGMAVLQAWPGRGSWQGLLHGQLGTVAGMAESMTLTPQPGFLIDVLSSFASFDAAHGFAVNLFVVMALAVTGVVFAGAPFVRGGERVIRPVLIGFAALCLIVWVVIQDLGFLGGLGTDPNTMIPFILLAVSGYLALTRVPALATEGQPATAPALASLVKRLSIAGASSVLAVGGAVLIVLGAVPMAVAEASPNADPILADSIAGPATAVNYQAPGFVLAGPDGERVTLSSLRGRVVVLSFLSPACGTSCPPVTAEFTAAARLLGPAAGGIDFVVVRCAVPATAVLCLTGPSAQVERQYGSSAHHTYAYLIGKGGRVRRRFDLGIGPGSAATISSFAVLLAGAARQAS
jgi:hypothetical protein